MVGAWRPFVAVEDESTFSYLPRKPLAPRRRVAATARRSHGAVGEELAHLRAPLPGNVATMIRIPLRALRQEGVSGAPPAAERRALELRDGGAQLHGLIQRREVHVHAHVRELRDAQLPRVLL